MCSFICVFPFPRIHRIIRKLCYKKFLDFPDRYIIINRRKFPRPYLRVTPLGYINGHLRPSFFISTPLSQLFLEFFLPDGHLLCRFLQFLFPNEVFNFPLNSAPFGVFPISILLLINFYPCDRYSPGSNQRGRPTAWCLL